jgi:hypothetical protein
LGNADWINEEGAKYMNISVEDLQNRALELFDPNKVSMIYYRSNDAKR